MTGDDETIEIGVRLALAIGHALYAPVPDLILEIPDRGGAPFHRPHKTDPKETP